MNKIDFNPDLLRLLRCLYICFFFVLISMASVMQLWVFCKVFKQSEFLHVLCSLMIAGGRHLVRNPSFNIGNSDILHHWVSEFYFEIMATGPTGSGGRGSSSRSGLATPSHRLGVGLISSMESPLGFSMLRDIRPEIPPRRFTTNSTAVDVDRWRESNKNVGCFLDNHMAMMKARQFVVNARVPSLANVYIHVGRRTVLANNNVLACGSRYFEQLFRFQMTDPQAIYVRAQFKRM